MKIKYLGTSEVRNDPNLAPSPIAQCLDPDGELDHGAVTDFEPRLAAIRPEAERLCSAIHEAANKFRGHLWFDEIPS